MKKEKHHPQFQLLEFLEKTGVSSERNISDFIVENFTRPNVRISNGDDKAIQFLQSMLKRELVKYNVGQANTVNNNYINANPNQSIELPMWFDEVKVMGNITMAGLEYLNQHRLNESIINSNAIISKNSDAQTASTIKQTQIFKWTAVFAFGALLISGITLWRDFHKDKLHQLLLQKDSLIQQLQNKLYHSNTDSSLLIMAKKTLPKKK